MNNVWVQTTISMWQHSSGAIVQYLNKRQTEWCVFFSNGELSQQILRSKTAAIRFVYRNDPYFCR